MKQDSRLQFFEKLLPLSAVYGAFWRSEIFDSWIESKTLLKSILENFEEFKSFALIFGSDMTLARVGATLTYLDQYENLKDKFSSFTEFSMGLALFCSEAHRHSQAHKRVFTALCKMDFYNQQALYATEEEWLKVSNHAFKDLELLWNEAEKINPLLDPKTQQGSKTKLRVA